MRKTAKAKRRGRPSIGTETITFRLDKELYERIEAFARDEDRPISNALRVLIEAALDSKSYKGY